MPGLLISLYPARWRDRYGEEFAAVLESRTLGPFDVADVVLGALDAHLNLRGLGAASEHRKGFAMSLRIGGYAAILGGLLWFLVLVGNWINDGRENGVPFLGLAVVLAMAATLVALVGLSAFQARRHPLLTWAAFAIPGLGAVVGLLGWILVPIVGEGPLAGGISPWMVGSIGLLTMILGSCLFAIATWRTRTLSRRGSVLLAVGSVLVVLALLGFSSGGGVSPATFAMFAAAFVLFPAGWVVLGISALRVTGPAPVTFEGASL